MNPKLQQRIETAVFIGIILIPMLLLSVVTAQVIFVIIMLGMLFEYFRLVFADRSAAFTYLFTGILLSMAVLYVFLRYLSTDVYIRYSLVLICMLCIGNIVFLLWKKKALIALGVYRIQAIYYITLPIAISILYLGQKEDFQWFIFAVFVLIWISDSAAYMIGSRFGKKKLFPSISPKKTYAGFFGAGISLVPASVGVAWVEKSLGLSDWLILGLIIWVFGTFGDLVESSLKRRFNVKDTGTFLPGHGGFLDRFDSFIFVLPVILLYLTYKMI